jgi:prevent-host-death family protein
MAREREHETVDGAAADTGAVAVGVRELRASLADAIARARAGQRCVITQSGVPVAQLGPVDTGAPTLAQLLASGALIPPRRTGVFRAPEAVSVWQGVRIDQALRELRG